MAQPQPPQPVTNPPTEFDITAIVDNGATWHSTGSLGEGQEVSHSVDRDTARSEAP